MNGLASDGPLVRGSNRRVRINVGGKIFETTTSTLQSAGKSSLLARSVPALPSDSAEIFFDRDPRLFAPLLVVLRTGKLPGAPPEHAERDALIEEAIHYGVLHRLRAAMAPPPLQGYDADRVTVLVPTGSDHAAAVRAAADGSVWVGHGNKITAYDWALRKRTTTLTELNTVSLIERISDSRAAVGAHDYPGLHVYDTLRGAHVKSFVWSDPNDTRIFRPCVRSVASSSNAVFAAFESGQRSDNAILALDKENLEIVREMGRQSGNSAHSKVATCLGHVDSKGLLMAAGIHGGAFGYSGYIRLWDLRAEKIVWEWSEPNSHADPRMMERDSFADVAVSEAHGALFKVSVINGNLGMLDLRHLKTQGDPWLHLTETNPALAVDGGTPDSKLLCYGKEIFCSRGGDLEVWSELPVATSDLAEKEYWETSFRRNHVEHSRRQGRQEVVGLDGGGERLFVARTELQGVEVWESRGLVSDLVM